jgi:hypothetical protein
LEVELFADLALHEEPDERVHPGSGVPTDGGGHGRVDQREVCARRGGVGVQERARLRDLGVYRFR